MRGVVEKLEYIQLVEGQRRGKRLTDQEFADLVGIPRSTYSAYRRRVVLVPTVKFIRRLQRSRFRAAMARELAAFLAGEEAS